MENIDEKKNAYLKKFDRENDLFELGWGDSKIHGEEIVKLLQDKEGLTYEEAYVKPSVRIQLIEIQF